VELFNRILKLIDVNLIYCLPAIILTLILVEFFFKNRFETRKTLNLICWVIIIYTIVSFSFYLIGMIMNPDEYAFIHRATGPYAWAYWMMFLGTLILPLTLLIKRLASKFWYVLLVAIGMKIGVYFERFVIIVTSYHRDYLVENENGDFINTFSFGIGLIYLQGMIIAILALGIFEIIKRKKTIHNSK